jgi:hypothetical protein
VLEIRGRCWSTATVCLGRLGSRSLEESLSAFGAAAVAQMGG